MSAPQIISSETLVPAAGGGGGASAAMELGRRLLVAARAGDTAGVRALLARGAPLAADWLGTSPLHLAAAHAHADTARVLLRAGVSRDARTKVERTPLHVAAAGGHAGVARALLAAGAAVDPRDMLRMTPLHWAVQRAHAPLAALLVRHGADPTATSKFLKTPLAMAQAQPAVLHAIEAALRERDAARSVSALVHEEVCEEPADPDLEPVQRAPDVKPVKMRPAQHDKKRPKTELKTESACGGAAGGAGAAQLLRAHGIALLPADDGSTVLSALQSGRTVVLSDAGKLMLKESSSPPRGAASGGGGGGVVVTATPATSPPAPGVKVFTLSAGAGAGGGPAARRAAPRHPQQVKLVQLPPDAKLAAPPARRAAPPAPGSNVKIIMNRANFQKLIATATRAHLPPAPPHAQATVRVSVGGEGGAAPGEVGAGEEGEGEGEESVVVVPEQFVRSASAHYLRSQLLCAHAALHALGGELRAARARLARLEAAPPPRAPP